MMDKSFAGEVSVLAGTLFLLLLASPALAAFPSYPSADYFERSCLDNETAHYAATISNTDCNQTECTETWSYDKECLSGCSDTLHDCRADEFTQGIQVALLVLFISVLLYFGPRFGPLGIVLGAGILLFVIYIAAFWDVFSPGPQYFLLVGLPVATVVYFAFHYYAAKPEDQPSSDVEEGE